MGAPPPPPHMLGGRPQRMGRSLDRSGASTGPRGNFRFRDFGVPGNHDRGHCRHCPRAQRLWTRPTRDRESSIPPSSLGGEAAEASETGRNRAAIGPYCSPGRERSIYSTFMMPVGDGQQRALSSSRLGPASGQDLVSQLHKCALSASRGPFNAPNEVL